MGCGCIRDEAFCVGVAVSDGRPDICVAVAVSDGCPCIVYSCRRRCKRRVSTPSIPICKPTHIVASDVYRLLCMLTDYVPSLLAAGVHTEFIDWKFAQFSVDVYLRC